MCRISAVDRIEPQRRSSQAREAIVTDVISDFEVRFIMFIIQSHFSLGEHCVTFQLKM